MDLTHAHLMDRTYRHQRLIYDATRRYYLLGRDRLIAGLAPPPRARILEVACGTGRNLHLIQRRYPDAELYGLDISAEMLRSARLKLGDSATLAFGDACSFDAQVLFGTQRFERIVLSYSLSMIPDWEEALTHAAAHLTPGGELHLVDFGMQSGLPGWFRTGLQGWLARFHVTPRADLPAVVAATARAIGGHARCNDLFRGYARQAVLTR